MSKDKRPVGAVSFGSIAVELTESLEWVGYNPVAKRLKMEIKPQNYGPSDGSTSHAMLRDGAKLVGGTYQWLRPKQASTEKTH